MNYNMEGLLKLIPGEQYQWMRQRVKDSWFDWVQAGKFFETLNQKYFKKKVANDSFIHSFIHPLIHSSTYS